MQPLCVCLFDPFDLLTFWFPQAVYFVVLVPKGYCLFLGPWAIESYLILGCRNLASSSRTMRVFSSLVQQTDPHFSLDS